MCVLQGTNDECPIKCNASCLDLNRQDFLSLPCSLFWTVGHICHRVFWNPRVRLPAWLLKPWSKILSRKFNSTVHYGCKWYGIRFIKKDCWCHFISNWLMHTHEPVSIDFTYCVWFRFTQVVQFIWIDTWKQQPYLKKVKLHSSQIPWCMSRKSLQAILSNSWRSTDLWSTIRAGFILLTFPQENIEENDPWLLRS